MKNILIIGQKSKLAFENLKKTNHKKINKTLDDYIKLISTNKKKIIRENKKDVKNLKRRNVLDRLILNEKKIKLDKEDIKFLCYEVPANLKVWKDFLIPFEELRKKVLCVSFTLLSNRLVFLNSKVNKINCCTGQFF